MTDTWATLVRETGPQRQPVIERGQRKNVISRENSVRAVVVCYLVQREREREGEANEEEESGLTLLEAGNRRVNAHFPKVDCISPPQRERDGEREPVKEKK